MADEIMRTVQGNEGEDYARKATTTYNPRNNLPNDAINPDLNKKSPMFSFLPHMGNLMLRDMNGSREFWLTCDHVYMMNNGTTKRKHLSGFVRYRFIAQNQWDNPKATLTLQPRSFPVSSLEPDEVNSRIKIDSPDAPMRGLLQHSIGYDMRAVMYVCGFYCMRLVFDYNIEMPNTPTPIDTIWNGMEYLTYDSFIVSQMCIRGNSEWVTLAELLGLLKVDVLYTAGTLAPTVGKAFTGPTLAIFLMRLCSQILCVAASKNAAGAHIGAWFRGATSAVSMAAHNDEGGWLRGLLKNAVYPKPCGFLSAEKDTFASMPTTNNVSRTAIKRHIMTWYMTCARCVSCSDPVTEGNPLGITYAESIVAETNLGRPSEFPMLEALVYDWWKNFKENVAKAFNCGHDSTEEMNPFDDYFTRDRVDPHLRADFIQPFFWVEPSPLDVFEGIDDHFKTMGSYNKAGELPIINQHCYVGKNADYREVEGAPLNRSGVTALLANTCARENGVFLLSGSKYATNPERAVIITKQGQYEVTEFAMSRGGTPFVGQACWYLPDCTIPNPGETWVGASAVMLGLKYKSNGILPRFDDLKTPQKSYCSVAYIEQYFATGERLVEKNVSSRHKVFLNKTITKRWAEVDAEEFMFPDDLPSNFVPKNAPTITVNMLSDTKAVPMDGISEMWTSEEPTELVEHSEERTKIEHPKHLVTVDKGETVKNSPAAPNIMHLKVGPKPAPKAKGIVEVEDRDVSTRYTPLTEHEAIFDPGEMEVDGPDRL